MEIALTVKRPQTAGISWLILGSLITACTVTAQPERPRARDIGLTPGILPPGPLNAITDVAGVQVGHHTLIKGDSIRTGVGKHSDALPLMRYRGC